MVRAPLFAAACLAAFAVTAPAAAQGSGFRAEFAAPFAEATKVVIDGRQWSCEGTTCVAAGSDPRPAVACRKLARKLGRVSRFTTGGADLDAEGLASCNQDQG